MNAVTQKSIYLLNEIHNICQENCLTYSLGLKSIISFKYDIDTINYDILMPVKDMIKFIDIIKNKKCNNRTLEYMKNSKHYLGYDVSYVDTSTTAINLNKGKDFKHLGIKVIIRPVRRQRNERTFVDKISSIIETGWNCNGYNLTRKFVKKRLIALVIVRTLMIIGRGNLAKIIFNLCTKTSLIGEKMYIKSPGKKRIYFDQDYFDSIELEEFGENKFYVVKNNTELIKKKYGPYWKTNVEDILKYSDFVIVPNEGYLKVINDLKKYNISLSSFFRKQRLNMVKAFFVFKSFKYRNRVILIAKRSGDRLKFYEQFEDIHDHIIKLYREKNYTELSKIFEDHEKVTLNYLKKNIGFCVNKEYFNIQCYLLREQKKYKAIKKLKKLVPKKHYKSII